MTRELTNELLDEIQEAFNRQDVEAILAHFVEDCEWVMASGPDAPQGRCLRGKAAIGAVLRERFVQIPDMRWDDMRHWICDQSKALSEWVVRGTPVDGPAFEYLGCDLWEFRDGMVTKKDTYWKIIT